MSERNDSETNAKLYWLLVASYLLHCIGKLPESTDRSLDRHTVDAGVADWKVVVERELGIDQAFIERLYATCKDKMEANRALLYMLRGFGYPDPVDRIAEAME